MATALGVTFGAESWPAFAASSAPPSADRSPDVGPPCSASSVFVVRDRVWLIEKGDSTDRLGARQVAAPLRTIAQVDSIATTELVATPPIFIPNGRVAVRS